MKCRLGLYASCCVATAVLLVGCSPVLEANRPDPVDVSQFKIGEKRRDVLTKVGEPKAIEKDGKNSCDIYQLYTKGHSNFGKGAIAAGEVLADLMTLGLTEIVFTPIEERRDKEVHAVIFCYNQDHKLVSISQWGKSLAPAGTTTNPAGPSQFTR